MPTTIDYSKNLLFERMLVSSQSPHLRFYRSSSILDSLRFYIRHHRCSSHWLSQKTKSISHEDQNHRSENIQLIKLLSGNRCHSLVLVGEHMCAWIMVSVLWLQVFVCEWISIRYQMWGGFRQPFGLNSFSLFILFSQSPRHTMNVVYESLLSTLLAMHILY